MCSLWIFITLYCMSTIILTFLQSRFKKVNDPQTGLLILNSSKGLDLVFSSLKHTRDTGHERMCEREKFLDVFPILHLTLSTGLHSTSTNLAKATKEPSTLYSGLIRLPVHSSCSSAHCVILLLIIITCFLSLFLCRSHFLSHIVTHIFTYRGGWKSETLSMCVCKREQRYKEELHQYVSYWFYSPEPRHGRHPS